MKKLKGLIIMLLISLSLFGMTACGGDNKKDSTYELITLKIINSQDHDASDNHNNTDHAV